MELTPTTELEAVNEMLEGIGEVPLNTLVITGLSDAAIAVSTLRVITREVLGRGWYFNKDEEVSMTPAVDGLVAVAANVLKIKPNASESRRLVQRESKIYDRDEKSFVFTVAAPPIMDIIWFQTFEQLPETFRRYITIRAARAFQVKVTGSEALDAFTERDELAARYAALEEQDEMEPANYCTDSSSVAGIWNT